MWLHLDGKLAQPDSEIWVDRQVMENQLGLSLVVEEIAWPKFTNVAADPLPESAAFIEIDTKGQVCFQESVRFRQEAADGLVAKNRAIT